MQHGLTDEDWGSYLEGFATPHEQARMDAHLLLCSECRDFAEQMRAVEVLMKSSARRLRSSVVLDASQIAAARDRVLPRMETSCVSMRVGTLHLLLAPMCGVKTSVRVIRAAALNVSAASPRLLTDKLWPGFLEQLQLIVASLCGEPAARLIRDRGMNFARSTP
jgi:predicted anti-sigma-YlaC factor YlaD